jgi:hypothetical protein
MLHNNFISLDEALTGIADKAPVPRALAGRSEDADAWRYSEAAAKLHACLHNNPGQRPKWIEQHKITKQHLRNDAVSNEGMEILEHMAGWEQRQSKERSDHRVNCTIAGYDPDTVLLGSSVNGGKYNFLKTTWGRDKVIGFFRAELVDFINSNNISHTLTNDVPTAKVEVVKSTIRKDDDQPPGKMPAPKQQRQDALAVELDEILKGAEKRTPAFIMAKLKERIGKPHTCITANVGDGLQWERNQGKVETLTIGALGERIANWKKKKNTG